MCLCVRESASYRIVARYDMAMPIHTYKLYYAVDSSNEMNYIVYRAPNQSQAKYMDRRTVYRVHLW